MAWSWLATADSTDTVQPPAGETVPSENSASGSERAESGEGIPSELEPLDFRILTMLFEGTKPLAIMAALSLDRPEFDARAGRPAFKELELRVEKAMLAKITGRGDFEPITAARAESPQAMRRLIAQSRTERDPKVRLAANQAVLKYGGVEPARRIEVTTPDKILDQMTPQELALFAMHKQWPGRFREALRAYLPAPTTQLASPLDVDGEVETEPPKVRRLADDDTPQSTLPPVDA